MHSGYPKSFFIIAVIAMMAIAAVFKITRPSIPSAEKDKNITATTISKWPQKERLSAAAPLFLDEDVPLTLETEGVSSSAPLNAEASQIPLLNSSDAEELVEALEIEQDPIKLDMIVMRMLELDSLRESAPRFVDPLYNKLTGLVQTAQMTDEEYVLDAIEYLVQHLSEEGVSVKFMQLKTQGPLSESAAMIINEYVLKEVEQIQ